MRLFRTPEAPFVPYRQCRTAECRQIGELNWTALLDYGHGFTALIKRPTTTAFDVDNQVAARLIFYLLFDG
jgi:hypothetical protein